MCNFAFRYTYCSSNVEFFLFEKIRKVSNKDVSWHTQYTESVYQRYRLVAIRSNESYLTLLGQRYSFDKFGVTCRVWPNHELCSRSCEQSSPNWLILAKMIPFQTGSREQCDLTRAGRGKYWSPARHSLLPVDWYIVPFRTFVHFLIFNSFLTLH